jgi:hypothetical protein
MLNTVIAIFKGSQQAQSAIEEIREGSLANSKISLMVLTEFLQQGESSEEIASELAYSPRELNLDQFNAWLVQAPPIDVPNLGEVLVAGPLASELMHQAQGRGFVDVLQSYGLSEIRAHHYEHEIRTGHWFVLIQTNHDKINKLGNTLRSYGGRDIEKWNTEIGHPIYPIG